MKIIIFVCHGNICRSPVASIIFNKLVKEKGLDERYFAISRATSLEEIGNDIYPPMKKVLKDHQVSFDRHYATRLTKEEINEATAIYYMDENNLYYLKRLFGENEKYKPLDNFDIEDPWYTGRYEYVYQRILAAINKIVDHLN